MGIQIKNLVKRFGSLTVVNDISVDIKDGEFFTLLGSSGCGKTTTLRMIAGLETPSEGKVLIHGKDVTYAEPRHRDIAMAFQDYGLYPNMSVFENIEFPLKIRKLPEAERRKKVEETAGTLGIGDYLGRKPAQMSGGQRQAEAFQARHGRWRSHPNSCSRSFTQQQLGNAPFTFHLTDRSHRLPAGPLQRIFC
ncbi:ABC transporter ATP-binding protein [Microbulbifer sp. S227A]|uniref:ABC transporter ATP-binding protein n=1 Tax=Microbulbifer sp. S227A TaxID=3415131 RepID=UPI003C7B1A01